MNGWVRGTALDLNSSIAWDICQSWTKQISSCTRWWSELMIFYITWPYFLFSYWKLALYPELLPLLIRIARSAHIIRWKEYLDVGREFFFHTWHTLPQAHGDVYAWTIASLNIHFFCVIFLLTRSLNSRLSKKMPHPSIHVMDENDCVCVLCKLIGIWNSAWINWNENLWYGLYWWIRNFMTVFFIYWNINVRLYSLQYSMLYIYNQ